MKQDINHFAAGSKKMMTIAFKRKSNIFGKLNTIMGHKKIEHDAFEEIPKGKRAVVSYSHYYHQWMIANEKEEEEWDEKWWERERYINTFCKWAYIEDILTKGKVEE